MVSAQRNATMPPAKLTITKEFQSISLTQTRREELSRARDAALEGVRIKSEFMAT